MAHSISLLSGRGGREGSSGRRCFGRPTVRHGCRRSTTAPPVSVYSVGRELGHGGDALVRRVYGHLGEVRHRSEVMEYRVEHFTRELEDRLSALA